MIKSLNDVFDFRGDEDNSPYKILGVDEDALIEAIHILGNQIIERVKINTVSAVDELIERANSGKQGKLVSHKVEGLTAQDKQDIIAIIDDHLIKPFPGNVVAAVLAGQQYGSSLDSLDSYINSLVKTLSQELLEKAAAEKGTHVIVAKDAEDFERQVAKVKAEKAAKPVNKLDIN